MSATIQSCLWNRSLYPNYFSTNTNKELAQQDFIQCVYGDRSFINRLDLHKELVGHQGCVNALYWSQYGDKLLSGSDDQTLRIWHPFDGDDHQKKVVIETGHRDNIFAAKFMPNTADQIVISAAGDSEIRIFDLNGSPNEQLQHIYTCHSDPVKRICTEAYNPYIFLTCAEDGTVRQFDLRQPHICTPHYVRSFNTAMRQHSRNYSSQHRTVSPRPLREGCPRPLLDYSQYGLDINSMTVNKHRPQYFVIAGMDDYMYLHDRRMIRSSSFDHDAGRNVDRSPASQCVLRFTPSDNQQENGPQRNRYVTACRFSDSNGYELLGNWAASGVYLFNILDTPIGSERWTSTLKQSSEPAIERLRQYQQQRSPQSPISLKTSPSPPLSPLATDPMTMPDDATFLDNDYDDSSSQTTFMIPQPPSDQTKLQAATNRERVIQAMENGDLSQALGLLNEHYLYLQHDGGGNESSLDSQTPQQQEITRLEHMWLHCMTAVIFATRATRNVKTPGFDRNNTNDERTQNVNDDLTAIRVQITKAQQIAPKNWKGLWCFAVTYWLICGGDTSVQEWEKGSTTSSASSSSLETTKSAVQQPLLIPGVARYLLYTAHYTSKVLRMLTKISNGDRYEIARHGYARLFIYHMDVMQQLTTTTKSGFKLLSRKLNPRQTSSTTDEPSLRHHRYQHRSTPPPSLPSPPSSSSQPPTSLPMSPLEDRTDWLRLLYPFPFPTKTAPPTWSPSDSLLYNGVLMNPRLYSGDENYVPTDEELCSVLQPYPHGGDNDDDSAQDNYNNTILGMPHDDDDDDMDGDESNTDSDDDDSDDSNDLNRVMDYLSMDDGFFDIGDDPSTSNDFDELERHQRSIRADFQSNVGIIGHRKKYTGHGNIRTIKDVNFYGAQDEYIVSGSDDGRAFVWDKKTGQLVQILKADQDTVNVIQGHPFFPSLAISGIDNTIKIFTPTAAWNASSTSQMDQVNDIVERNARYHRDRQQEAFLTRSFLENMARLYRQRHPDWIQMGDSDTTTTSDDGNDNDISDLFSSGMDDDDSRDTDDVNMMDHSGDSDNGDNGDGDSDDDDDDDDDDDMW